ncbi:MAG TPA: PLP-dependent aminotransferase family protein [Streptosporangiaceae bacterium]
MPDSGSRVIVEPPLVLDRGGATPLAAQITGQLRTAVLSRRLRAGERLPSSRALAATLGVSRTVVTNAYTQLFAEGWLEGRHGSGTYVAEGAAGGAPPATGRPAARPARPVPPPWPAPPQPAGAVQDAADGGPPLVELRPGIPWVPGLDRAAWRRAWRQAGTAVPSRWPDPRGLLALRAALCAHLRRTRGLDCTPDHVLITRGVGSGLGLLAPALLQAGDTAGIEDPGYPVARSVMAAWGARVTPCPVDSHGLLTGSLPDGLRLMYVTPAHQYPLGGRLPVPRRQELVAWARATGALIVEDDYDSEFRYDVAPLPALYGLDPDVVAYLGTTAKTLTPTFGVGWLVARPDLVTVLAGTRESQGDRTGESAQRALLAMMESGDLDRHIRRMRRVYARRRDAIVSILGDPAVPGTLRGDTAGLHVVLELPGGQVDEVVAAARRRGLVLHTLRRYFAGPPTAAGLVLGYGAVPEAQVAASATVLRDVLLGMCR